MPARLVDILGHDFDQELRARADAITVTRREVDKGRLSHLLELALPGEDAPFFICSRVIVVDGRRLTECCVHGNCPPGTCYSDTADVDHPGYDDWRHMPAVRVNGLVRGFCRACARVLKSRVEFGGSMVNLMNGLSGFGLLGEPSIPDPSPRVFGISGAHKKRGKKRQKR